MANLLEKLTSGLTKTRSISSAIDTLLGASDAAAARTAIGFSGRIFAWANFGGVSSITMRGSGGVSSVVRAAAGTYNINFLASAPSTNYAVLVTRSSAVNNTEFGAYEVLASRSVVACQVVSFEGGTLADSPNVSVVVIF